MDRSGNLYSTAKSYVEAAIELLGERCPEGPPERVAGALEYVRATPNLYQLREHEFPYWHRTMWSHPKPQHALSEYHAFVQAMRSEPEIARYIDTVAGTKRGWSHLRIDEIADCLIWRMADARGRLEFDPAEFDRLYSNFCVELERDDVEFEAVAPILGFKTDSTSIRLDEGLEIDRLTDEEILRCLVIGPPMGFQTAGTMHLYADSAVKYRFREKKLFGAVQNDSKALRHEYEEITAKFLEVSHALRLFKKGWSIFQPLLHSQFIGR
jgi:hypothetical protein